MESIEKADLSTPEGVSATATSLGARRLAELQGQMHALEVEKRELNETLEQVGWGL